MDDGTQGAWAVAVEGAPVFGEAVAQLLAVLGHVLDVDLQQPVLHGTTGVLHGRDHVALRSVGGDEVDQCPGRAGDQAAVLGGAGLGRPVTHGADDIGHAGGAGAAHLVHDVGHGAVQGQAGDAGVVGGATLTSVVGQGGRIAVGQDRARDCGGLAPCRLSAEQGHRQTQARQGGAGVEAARHKRHQGASQAHHDSHLETLHARATVVLAQEVDVLVSARQDVSLPHFWPPGTGEALWQGHGELAGDADQACTQHGLLDGAVGVDDVLAVCCNERTVVEDAQAHVVGDLGQLVGHPHALYLRLGVVVHSLGCPLVSGGVDGLACQEFQQLAGAGDQRLVHQVVLDVTAGPQVQGDLGGVLGVRSLGPLAEPKNLVRHRHLNLHLDRLARVRLLVDGHVVGQHLLAGLASDHVKARGDATVPGVAGERCGCGRQGLQFLGQLLDLGGCHQAQVDG